jgi:hypothetical protein
MHLAKKEPHTGPKIVYGDNEQEESLALTRSSKRRRSVEVAPSSASSVADVDLDDNEPKANPQLEGGLLGRLSILGGAKPEN